MKFEEPQNANYAAVVVRVKNLVKLENSDFLQGVPLFGLQAITDLKTQVGDMGIFFPAETQLSFEFAHYLREGVTWSKSLHCCNEMDRTVVFADCQCESQDEETASCLPLGTMLFHGAPVVRMT